MRGNSESINKPLSAALLDGVGQRRRRYVETGYHRRRLALFVPSEVVSAKRKPPAGRVHVK